MIEEKMYQINFTDELLTAYEIEELVFELSDLLAEDDNEVKYRRLECVCENVGEEAEASIRKFYSLGNGNVCVGIISNNPISVIEHAAQMGILGAKIDSLGKKSIVYWPDIQFVEIK